MKVARPDTLVSLIPAYRAAMFNRASAFNQFRTLFAPRKPRHPLVRVAVGLLGLAIVGMHYTGMAAARFVGAADPVGAQSDFSLFLALAVALITVSLTIFVAGVNGLLRYRQLFQQVQASEARVRAILDTAVDGVVTIDAGTFECCPDNSIDYAVMEKTQLACVVPMSAGWSDVGSWSSIWDVHEKDQNGNVLKGDVIAEDSRNCLVHGNGKLVTVLGLEDIVVVETKDAMMVAHKDKVQDVKKLVSKLDAQERSETKNHCAVYRPWGWYDSVDMGGRFQVKRICVNPGASLSLQMHHHRAEHWIVVSGTAQVTCNDKTFLLTENQSTYIPITSVHRLANPGKIPLEIIEVQSGSYLGEDDIERFDDVYGRAEQSNEAKVAR